jgi:hypothetical protein
MPIGGDHQRLQAQVQSQVPADPSQAPNEGTPTSSLCLKDSGISRRRS